MRGGYWIEAIRASTLQIYSDFIFGKDIEALKYLLQMVFIAAVIVLIYHWKKEKKDRIFFMCGFVFFGFIALGVALSVLITPVFNKRYIIIVLPIFWMAVVCILCQLKNKRVYLALGVLGLLLFTVQYQKEFTHRIADENISAFYEMSGEIKEGDVIYTTSPYLMADMAAYFPETKQYLPDYALEGEAFHRWDEMTNCVMVEGIQEFCEEKEGSVWLLVYDEEEETVECLEQNGYTVKSKGKETLGWDGWNNDSITLRLYKCTLAE